MHFNAAVEVQTSHPQFDADSSGWITTKNVVVHFRVRKISNHPATFSVLFGRVDATALATQVDARVADLERRPAALEVINAVKK
ncbi:hypothetical protein PTKU64_84890 [Paraburkholderia terrae]|uniref:Uncharacterized protein n=1 Tax=Paraburkholderia terrae TaxID=311230 RepID=A0ABM7U0V9_9BURK|nr:hypothetical protein PTKU64_84890 [Paraburkholderia terrae]